MDLEKLRIRLTNDEINELPLVHYQGPIMLVKTDAELNRVMPDILAEPVIGFDTETQPTYSKGVVHLPSLIQLATAYRVYLIQVCRVSFDQRLARVLENPKQLKVGVAIGDDMKLLARLHPFTPAGMVDLGDVARKYDLWSQGLRPLAANFLGIHISKGQQCSNWSARELSEKQILYAATDAWLGRRLYQRMQGLGLLEDE